MSSSPHRSKAPAARALSSQINVTPLIDVLLVMLIIFMVIQPTLTHGLDTLLPQPPKNPVASEPNPATIVVSVASSATGEPVYSINHTSLRKEALAPRLAEIFAARNDRQIFLQGDAALDFSTIAQVVDDAHRAGIDNIAILTPRTLRD